MVHVLLALIFSSWVAAEANHILVIGGGGEPQGPATIFDEEVAHTGDFLKDNKNWKVSLTFNGGHSETEKMLKQKFAIPNHRFTRESFENLISLYEEKLLNGSIKRGDKILIQISSHGAYQESQELSHRIATSEGSALDLNTLEGSGSVSLDRLQNLIQLASEKEVKLAILDFSCHSGSTLNLDHSKACIISSTGPKHFAWNGEGGFSYQFTQHMKSGKSLEEIFLMALEQKRSSDFPMISTEIGKSLQKDLYEGITPFLYEWRDKIRYDKFSVYIENEVIRNQCEEIPEIALLENFLKKAGVILGKEEIPTIVKLRDAIREYYEFQLKMREELMGMNMPLLKEKHRFCSELTESEGRLACETYSTLELISSEDSIDPMLEMSAFHGDEESVAKLKNVKKMLKKKKELMVLMGSADKFRNFYQSYPNLERTTHLLALKAAREAAILYRMLYEKQSKEAGSNPCKDFKL